MISSGHVQKLAVGHTRGITVYGTVAQGIKRAGVVNIRLFAARHRAVGLLL